MQRRLNGLNGITNSLDPSSDHFRKRKRSDSSEETASDSPKLPSVTELILQVDGKVSATSRPGLPVPRMTSNCLRPKDVCNSSSSPRIPVYLHSYYNSPIYHRSLSEQAADYSSLSILSVGSMLHPYSSRTPLSVLNVLERDQSPIERMPGSAPPSFYPPMSN